MAVWGIIAEYHPFHNGHQYQITRIREMDAEATIVVVMSGNFMQRGIPAMMDKWTRAEMALAGGADLVMELPAIFAVQAADYFAQGGVNVLAQLQVDNLCFGSEAGDTGDYIRDAELFLNCEEQLFEIIRNRENKHFSYPRALAEAMEEMSLDFSVDLTEPNNLLGFSYAKEILKQNSKMDIRAIPRKSSHHHSQALDQGVEFASGSAIRKGILNGEDITPYLPDSTNEILQANQSPYMTWDNYWPYLNYQLLVRSTSELQMIYQMNNGLENLLQQSVKQANTYSEFIESVHNKAYTRARIERLLVYTLLGWEEEQVLNDLDQPANLRVLGFSDVGREYLNGLRKEAVRPDTIIDRANRQKYQRDIVAGEIYRLGNLDKIKKQDYTRKPLQKH